ncbi:MAG: PleD family two-component system response regulator [Armatimonadota bacterium]
MSGGKRVLVVDDDVDFVDAIRLTLEAAGYEVAAVNTAEAAIEAVREKPVQVAVLDMMMEEPDSGAMVAHALRRRPEMKDIPVILVTGVAEQTGYRVAPESPEGRALLGVDIWLDKPVEPQELLKKIEGLTSE